MDSLARSITVRFVIAIDQSLADIEYLTAIHRARAELDALEARRLANMYQARDGDSLLVDEIAPALRLSLRQAGFRVRRSVALTKRLPQVLHMMEAGEIEGRLATRLVRAVDTLDDADARSASEVLVEKLLAEKVPLYNPDKIVRALRRLVVKTDPDGQAELARRRRDARKLDLVIREGVVSTLRTTLPAETAIRCYSRVDNLAHRLHQDGDERTLDQLRADVTANLLLGHDLGISSTAAEATVFVFMPVDTALLMSNDACELRGYGPIPAAIARDIMANPNSTWRKVATDPGSGEIVELGRTSIRPSPLVRDAIALQDTECAVPWCHTTTTRTNLRNKARQPTGTFMAGDGSFEVCHRHQRLRDDPAWTIQYDPVARTTAVTTPSGKTYDERRIPVVDLNREDDARRTETPTPKGEPRQQHAA